MSVVIKILAALFFHAPLNTYMYITNEDNIRSDAHFLGHLLALSSICWVFGVLIALVAHYLGLGHLTTWAGLTAQFGGLYFLFYGWISGAWLDGVGDTHIRGARVVHGYGRQHADDVIQIAGIEVPESIIPLSFGIYGSPGGGKSQVINAWLTPIRQRGERALVADAGGEALAGWYEDGDLIFSPFDGRGVKWTPFAEIREVTDVDLLAAALVGGGQDGEAGEWIGYAQQLLSSIILRLFEEGKTSNADLQYHCLQASDDELKELLVGTIVEPWFSGKETSRALQSARFVLSGRARTLKYLKPGVDHEGSFSLTRWIEDDTAPWLWMNYREDQADAIKPFLQVAFDLSAARLLSRQTDLTRRVWFLADEFASLGKVTRLLDLATKGRKKGAVIVAGIQTIAQVQKDWGREAAQILNTCMQTWIAFRTSDAATAEYLSTLAGMREIQRLEKSESQNDQGSSQSEAIRHHNEKVLFPSEFQNLDSCHGFMKLAGNYPITRIEVPVVKPPHQVPAFVADDAWQLKPGQRIRQAPAQPKPASATESSGPAPLEF